MATNKGTKNDRIIIFIPKEYSEDSEKCKVAYNKKLHNILTNDLNFRKQRTYDTHELWAPNFSKLGDENIIFGGLKYESHYFVINKYSPHKVFTGRGLIFTLEIKSRSTFWIDHIRKEYEGFINKVRFAIEKDFIIINFGDGTLRTFEAKTKIDFLERDLRDFIVEEIRKCFGRATKEHVPGKIVERIKEDNLPIKRDSFYFLDLYKIIKHNWDDVFKRHFENKFKSKSKLKIAFGKINDSRNKISHNRGELTNKDVRWLGKVYNKFNEIIFREGH